METRQTRLPATILALSLTDWRSFFFGGEVPILVFDAQRQTVTVIAGPGSSTPASDP